MDTSDFYEDDESIDDVRAAYEAGEPGVTVARPELHGQITIKSVSVKLDNNSVRASSFRVENPAVELNGSVRVHSN